MHNMKVLTVPSRKQVPETGAPIISLGKNLQIGWGKKAGRKLFSIETVYIATGGLGVTSTDQSMNFQHTVFYFPFKSLLYRETQPLETKPLSIELFPSDPSVGSNEAALPLREGKP